MDPNLHIFFGIYSLRRASDNESERNSKYMENRDQSKEEVKQFQVDKRGRLEGMEETIPDK